LKFVFITVPIIIKKNSDGNYEVGGKNIFQFFCKFREGTQIFCERMCLNKKLK